jgi:hypothetical protein
VLIPAVQQSFPIQSQVANNIAEFVRGKANIGGNSEIVKPKFGFSIARSDMNMGRLAAFVRVEIDAVRTPSQDGRHDGSS